MDFKTETFEGTLLELLRTCNRDLPEFRTRFADQHEWLLGQYAHTPNLLPVRRGNGDNQRGSVIESGQRRFLVADNEPLASIYKTVLEGGRFNGSMETLLRAGEISASWTCDVVDKAGLSFKGVSSSFRKRGLKLAHIFDAAKGLEAVADRDDQLRLRFTRSLSTLNVFLFPNHRSCEWTLLEGWAPTSRDLAEDDFVRSVALGFVMSSLGLPEAAWQTFRAGLPHVDVNVPDDWERAAAGTVIRVSPRNSAGTVDPERTQTRGALAAARVPVQHGHSLRNRARDATEVRGAVERLRTWLANNPRAAQLDGSTVKAKNPAPWFHLRVDGYEGGAIFTSRNGPVFDGHDYNGVVNFHGDAPVQALRDFVDAVNDAEAVQDVLVPSATYEFTKKPATVKTIKPKFALKAYEDGVNGFFLYHDEHAGKPILVD